MNANAGEGPPPGGSATRKAAGRSTAACVVGLIVAVFLAYGNAIGNDFAYDDHELITGNQYLIGWMAGAPDLKGRPVDYVFRLLTSDFASLANRFQEAGQQIPLNYYRPVIAVSYLADTWFFMDAPTWGVDAPQDRARLAWSRKNPAGFHFTNILFHGVNVVLLFFLVRALFRRRALAFVAALVFAVHPMGTESVTWIAGRTDLIATTCWLAAFWAYVRFRRTGSQRALYTAFIVFTIGTFAKEMVATLPLALALFEVVRPALPCGAAGSRGAVRGVRRFVLPVAFAACLVPYFVIKTVSTGGTSAANDELWADVSTATVALTVPKAFAWYWLRLVAPLKHNAYPMLEFARGVVGWLPQLLLHLALVLGSIFGIRRGLARAATRAPGGALGWIGVGFGVLGIYISLLPLNCIVPGLRLARYPIDIEFPVSERFLYVPLIFFAMAVAVVVHRVLGRLGRGAVVGAGVVLGALGIGLTAVRNHAWTDNFHLFEASVEAAPNSVRMRLNYGAALVYDHYDIREGLRHLDHGVAVSVARGDRPLHNFFANLSYADIMRGAFRRAAEDEAKMFEFSPGLPGLANNVAVMITTFAAMTGDQWLYEKAAQHFAVVIDAQRSQNAQRALLFLRQAAKADARFRGTAKPDELLALTYAAGCDRAALGLENLGPPHRGLHALLVHDAYRSNLPPADVVATMPKLTAFLKQTKPRFRALLDRAASHYRKKAAAWPKAIALEYVLGELDRVEGRWFTADPAAARDLANRAVGRFRRVLEAWPDHPGAAHRLAAMLLDQGAAKAALGPVRRAIDAMFAPEGTWEGRPLIADPALAVDLIEAVASGRRTLDPTWRTLRTETWTRAFEQLERRAVAPAGPAWRGWHELGVLMVRGGRALGQRALMEQGVGHLRKAAQLGPESRLPLDSLIAALPAIGRHGEAKQILQRLRERAQRRRPPGSNGSGAYR